MKTKEQGLQLLYTNNGMMNGQRKLELIKIDYSTEFIDKLKEIGRDKV